jgi:hypothetical protein
MKIIITFNSRYREMDCTYCQQRIHTANEWLPGWASERIGKVRFWLHKRTADHKANRPNGALAPAPEIDIEAFQRVRDGMAEAGREADPPRDELT